MVRLDDDAGKEPMIEERLDGVQAAIDDADWELALEQLDDLGDRARSATALELRAIASYGAGRFEACISAWEELHARSLDAGDDAEAARAAAMIAMYLMMDTGLMAPAAGGSAPPSGWPATTTGVRHTPSPPWFVPLRRQPPPEQPCHLAARQSRSL